MSNDNPIKVGGPYVEDENHVPNPTDMVGQFNTEGVGAHGKIEEVSPIFEVDRVKTAQEILAATDPSDDSVNADRVLLPNPVEDNDVARDQIREAAEARVEKGVLIGGPTPAEAEGEKEGDEGEYAAVEQERSNAASNSTGNREAGQHSDAAGAPVATGTSASTSSPTGLGGGEEANAGDTSGDVKAGQESGSDTTSSQTDGGDAKPEPGDADYKYSMSDNKDDLLKSGKGTEDDTKEQILDKIPASRKK
jgi:hypothetical protein